MSDLRSLQTARRHSASRGVPPAANVLAQTEQRLVDLLSAAEAVLTEMISWTVDQAADEAAPRRVSRLCRYLATLDARLITPSDPVPMELIEVALRLYQRSGKAATAFGADNACAIGLSEYVAGVLHHVCHVGLRETLQRIGALSHHSVGFLPSAAASEGFDWDKWEQQIQQRLTDTELREQTATTLRMAGSAMITRFGLPEAPIGLYHNHVRRSFSALKHDLHLEFLAIGEQLWPVPAETMNGAAGPAMNAGGYETVAEHEFGPFDFAVSSDGELLLSVDTPESNEPRQVDVPPKRKRADRDDCEDRAWAVVAYFSKRRGRPPTVRELAAELDCSAGMAATLEAYRAGRKIAAESASERAELLDDLVGCERAHARPRKN